MERDSISLALHNNRLSQDMYLVLVSYLLLFAFCVLTAFIVFCHTVSISFKVSKSFITARRSYASAVLGVVILSVSLSVTLMHCHKCF